MARQINLAGLELIKRFEGCRLEAYRCPAGVLTIGYGHTGDVKEGMKITQHQCDIILLFDLEKFEKQVEELVPNASSNQFSALVCFAYNVGINALIKSNLLRKFKAGGPLAAAPEFLKWAHAGGKELPGLVKRREAERELFLTPDAS